MDDPYSDDESGGGMNGMLARAKAAQQKRADIATVGKQQTAEIASRSKKLNAQAINFLRSRFGGVGATGAAPATTPTADLFTRLTGQ